MMSEEIVSNSPTPEIQSSLDELAVNNFREYLQIPSVHPDVNYDACVAFFKKQAESLGLPLRTFYTFPGKPMVIITWTGQEPNIPSIMINSHMDVVPVYEDKWIYKPFAATIDANGNIYARGSQDTKCVGIQYLEAIRRLKQQNVTLRRTIHLVFSPEEETGGEKGMGAFVKTDEFRALNVGFELDEGVLNPGEEFVVLYGERCVWQLIFHCPGTTGHGSSLIDNTPGEKIHYILNKMLGLREEEKKKKLQDYSILNLGDVISINLTQLKGGLQPNLIPTEFTALFDCRIPASVDIKKFEETLNQWCKEAGEGVWIEYEEKSPQIADTKLDETNPFWIAFKDVAEKEGLQLKPIICPGGTDGRFLREIGIPSIGFTPINNTPVLAHDNNEYVNKDKFLEGIKILCKVLPAVTNVEHATE